jgi:hypothetical protein
MNGQRKNTKHLKTAVLRAENLNTDLLITKQEFNKLTAISGEVS